jgi:regulator of sigma E protease
VAAGPVMNFVMAVVIFGVVLFFYGQPTLIPHVGQVLDGYPAQAAGIKTGDLIVGLNGKEVATWEEMADFIASNGDKPVKVTVQRENELADLTMVPRMGESSDIFGETISKPMIGISPSGKTIILALGPGQALVGGFVQTWSVTKLTWETIVRLVQRRIPFSTLGGPIFIAQAAGQQAKSGWVNLFFFMGLLSVNLGILNILPIPVLDGGHLLFFGIEAVIRRPVSIKIRERAQQAGLVFLLVFFGFVFYNDILRLVAGPMGAQ